VEYASGEAERLNLPSTAEGTSVKLFIGGVPLSMTDDELREYFSEYGQVTECHVLAPKSSNPLIQTKAAFVRFARKADAMAAIDKLDKKVSFPGVERVMDVRVAEARTEAPKPDDRPPMRGSMAQRAPGMPYAMPQQHHRTGQTGPMMHPPPAAPARPPRTMGVWTEFYAADGRPYYHNSVTNVTTWDPPVEFRLVGPPAPAPPAYHQSVQISSGPVQPGGDAKGPAGANLFVFHVPMEWTESDMYSHFAPYGNVLTYRIARERETNRPKGFGFVSFDSPMSAQAAISGLNGMMVSNGKRLKVSLKKGEEGFVPGMAPSHYAMPY
jgi:CUG-BP- and ETR3-like factor